MLELSKFKLLVENTLLVSTGLCYISKGQILIDKRNNEPLKDEWFTPGEQIYKTEALKNAHKFYHFNI
jgi:hypothetical protein